MRPGIDELRRARILGAMAEVVAEHGFAGASVKLVCMRARVSRQTFYREFDGCEDCFLAVLDDGHRRVSAVIARAFERSECWREGLRAAFAEILSFLDADRRLARVWMVESLAAGSWALERRERHVRLLVELILARWPPPQGAAPNPLAAVSVMAAALGIVQTHLIDGNPESLLTLLGPLMGVATAPYLDARAVEVEIERAQELAQELILGGITKSRPETTPGALPQLLGNHRAHRARQCVLYLAENSGASNRQIATAIGVSSQPQMSVLLAGLAQAGLLHKQAGRPGRPNAWSLTENARRVLDENTITLQNHVVNSL